LYVFGPGQPEGEKLVCFLGLGQRERERERERESEKERELLTRGLSMMNC
jgi:hypothetical protein